MKNLSNFYSHLLLAQQMLFAYMLEKFAGNYGVKEAY